MKKMTRFHCIINIFNPFFEEKLKAKWKINSVWFYDYDVFFDKILDDLSFNDIQRMKLNLFEWYKWELSIVRCSQVINWECYDWYSIPNCQFNVPNDVLARCIWSRSVRDRYFDYDCLREKYYIKADFISYLKI